MTTTPTFDTPGLLDRALRPPSFAEFNGQPKVRARLEITVAAARERAEPLDHVLLSGPPGLGKTTLANIIAAEMGVAIKTTSGPALETVTDLTAILLGLNDRDILFIDEIHRLPKVIEEYLYPAIEDYVIDAMIGEGPQRQSMRLKLGHFTLIGATTRSGLISAPLLSRFTVRERLEYYTPEQLHGIVARSAGLLRMNMDNGATDEVAKRSRGTPRIANNLLRRVRDFAQIKRFGLVDRALADNALIMLGIDGDGLDEMDTRILHTMITKFGGGPVGCQSLAVACGEEPGTLQDVYEPYLIMQGYVKRTPQGRVATEQSFAKLGIAQNKHNEADPL